ncbi:MAG: enoyl-CoA hydratase/isomerase family protein [Chloroflexi bacterium]|nr:enoyl-CoA hydratase/isomerase family protein [Chloroflexota bacterium]
MASRGNDEILFEVDKDGLATMTLNRPRALNAFVPTMARQFVEALEKCRAPEVRAVLLTGAGRAFCAGADVSDKPGTPRPTEVDAQEYTIAERLSGRGTVYGSFDPHAAPRLFSHLYKPVIAAINGDAVGAGLDIALRCDVRLASDKARMGAVYIRRGTFASGGACFYLPRVVGLGRALELLLTGDIIDAQEAYRIGLVHHVYPPDQLLPAARELAGRLARGPWSTLLYKKMAFMFQDIDVTRALELTRMSSLTAHPTQDALEGRRAFREKREPVFKGK